MLQQTTKPCGVITLENVVDAVLVEGVLRNIIRTHDLDVSVVGCLTTRRTIKQKEKVILENV